MEYYHALQYSEFFEMYLVTAELCSGDNKVPSPSLLLDLHRDQYMVKGLLS